MAQELPDKFVKKEKDQFLPKSKWESAYITLSRTINESKVVGKPEIQKYFKTMKPEHLQYEFDGTYSKFLVI